MADAVLRIRDHERITLAERTLTKLKLHSIRLINPRISRNSLISSIQAISDNYVDSDKPFFMIKDTNLNPYNFLCLRKTIVVLIFPLKNDHLNIIYHFYLKYVTSTTFTHRYRIFFRRNLSNHKMKYNASLIE